MISSIIDVILLAALAGTTVAVLLMYRRLQRFDALQNAAAKEFARSSEALDRAREAIVRLQDDGGRMAVTLADRLNEARVVMNEIDEATGRTREAYCDIREFEMLNPRPERSPAPVSEFPEPELTAGPVEDEAADTATRGPVPAAIRIRDAARARINAAREKATGAPAVPRDPRTVATDGAAPATRATAGGATSDGTAPAQAAGEARLARTRPDGAPGTAAALAARRATPNGPIMMLVRNTDDTSRATAPAAPDVSVPPAPANGAELDAAMAAMNGRQLTWSELAAAAQRAS